MDVRDILRKVPNRRGESELWFETDQGYPWHVRILEVLQPKRYVEFGSLLGFSLIAALEGASSIDEIAWADTEAYVPESNRLCAENVTHYLGNAGRSVSFRHLPGVEALMELTEDDPVRQCYANADVLFVDGDHRYESAMRDMRFARSLGAQVMLVDDCLSGGDPHLRHAVREFSQEVGYSYCVVPTYAGMAFFDFREKPGGMRPGLGERLEQAGLPVQYPLEES